MAEDGFRNTAYGMGFEAGLDALRDVIGASKALVADLDGAENAWQGVGVLAVEIRKLVDLRVALRDAGYLRDSKGDSHSLVLESGTPECVELPQQCVEPRGRVAPECVEFIAGPVVQGGAISPAAGSITVPGSTYSPWLVDGRKPTIADYMASAGVRA